MELFIWLFIGMIFLLAIGTWWHARSIPPAEEYYAAELDRLEITHDDDEEIENHGLPQFGITPDDDDDDEQRGLE